jgi:phosphoribosyl 1,2-cyclic phosphodiesterase
MSVRFHVLASGSSGNACVLDANGFGVLIDFGLSPRNLEPRMKRCKVAWDQIHAVVLTHEHSDHWQPAGLTQFAKLGVPIYCHPDHLRVFDRQSRAFGALSARGLLRHYEPETSLNLNANCVCKPIAVDHDGSMTCGFRFEGPLTPNPSLDGRGEKWAIGYAADLGCWRPALAAHFADVDLLAIEFNHDVAMQIASGRSPLLIRRVLGDQGHLSNEQGAALFAEILKCSTPGRTRHLVQLHVSRECNFTELAHAAALRVVRRCGADVAIHTTVQGRAGPSIVLEETAHLYSHPKFVQPMLPF